MKTHIAELYKLILDIKPLEYSTYFSSIGLKKTDEDCECNGRCSCNTRRLFVKKGELNGEVRNTCYKKMQYGLPVLL